MLNISRDIRQMILEMKKPVISTIQANRKAAGHQRAELDEIAFSDAIGQDATLAARVINDKNSDTISIVIGGSREFDLGGFKINGVPAVDFSFHSLLTAKEIEKAKEQDTTDDAFAAPEKKTNGAGKKKTKHTESAALKNAEKRIKGLL